jgi:hypothetical protein
VNAYPGAQTSGNSWPGFYRSPAYEPPPQRRPTFVVAPREGRTIFEPLERQMADSAASRQLIVNELRSRFGMASDSAIVAFLASHRSLPHLLTEAFDRLKDAFGDNLIVNLEVSTDEDGNQMLYAITLWKADARQAASAFNSFVENWWVHRMSYSNSDVAFVYRLL